MIIPALLNLPGFNPDKPLISLYIGTLDNRHGEIAVKIGQNIHSSSKKFQFNTKTL